ncbi:hypothetical protein FRC06_006633 [Ceratobasidium sp. 370]|nr:hypothetical protein FRC06_006633 [Ceratobasidium sp. 370]
MSKDSGQESTGSAETLPFFGATHKKRTIAIRRNADYDATIRSIQKAFSALAKTPASRIIISAVFSEYGSVSIEIGRDLWLDVLPRLKIVEISVDEEISEAEETAQVAGPVVGGTSQDLNNLVISHLIGIEVQSGLETYPLTLPGDSTIRYLKSLIQAEVPLQSSRLLPSTQGFSFLEDDKTLQHYNIKAQSLVTIISNIRVYVTTPRRSKMPIMATLYAKVSSLRLVISNRADVPYPECTLTCGGEILDDSKRLDSYAQVVPECEIVVRRREGIYFQKQFTLHIQPAWDQDEQEEYTVYPKTTVLDLKVLLYNVNIISPDRQVLTFKGRELQNEQSIQDQGVQNADTLTMKLYNGGSKED